MKERQRRRNFSHDLKKRIFETSIDTEKKSAKEKKTTTTGAEHLGKIILKQKENFNQRTLKNNVTLTNFINPNIIDFSIVKTPINLLNS